MKKSILLAGLVVLMSCPAWAQNDYPKAEIFGGFSWLSTGNGTRENDYGWQASVTGNFHKNVGFTADFAGQYDSAAGTTFQAYQYLLGPRLTSRGARVTGFAHALAGGITLRGGGQSETGFAMGLGGGVDINANDRIAIRVFQLDYLPVRFQGEWFKENFRVAAGIVFKFGGG